MADPVPLLSWLVEYIKGRPASTHADNPLVLILTRQDGGGAGAADYGRTCLRLLEEGGLTGTCMCKVHVCARHVQSS